jgi:hypothetical protein
MFYRLLVFLGGRRLAAHFERAFIADENIRRKVYDAHSEEVYKRAFELQTKHNWQSLCEVAFIDSDGRRYFRYKDEFKIPLDRLHKLERYLKEHAMCINTTELDKWIDACEGIVNHPDNNKLRSRIGHMLGILRDRKTILVDVEMLLYIAATMYIREDENPEEVDSVVEKEKVEQFKKDREDGSSLHGFFIEAGLSEYFPLLNCTAEEFGVLWMNSQVQLKTRSQTLSKLASAPH